MFQVNFDFIWKVARGMNAILTPFYSADSFCPSFLGAVYHSPFCKPQHGTVFIRAEDIPKLKLLLPRPAPAETLSPLPLLIADGRKIEIPQQIREEEAHF